MLCYNLSRIIRYRSQPRSQGLPKNELNEHEKQNKKRLRFLAMSISEISF